MVSACIAPRPHGSERAGALPGCSQSWALGLTPQSPPSAGVCPHCLPILLSSLSGTLTRLVLVQYHLQFGAGVLFRHIVKNTTALACCGTVILFVMLHSLARKTLSCRFSYRKYRDGHYCGNAQVTPKYYFYVPSCYESR